MTKSILLPIALFAALVGASPALAEESAGWKVMQPVAAPGGVVTGDSLESAAAAALPAGGGGAAAATVPGLSTAAAAALADEAPVTATVTEEAPQAESKPAAAAPAAPKADKPAGPAYLEENQPFKLKEYEEPKKAAGQPWWQTLLGFVVKLAIVIGLIFGSLVAVKKISGGKLPSLGAKGRNLVVLETTALSPQAGMHLVSVGGQLLVVGSGPQGLSTLATIDDPQQVATLLAAARGGQNTTFGQAYDMETVVQETDGELFRSAMRDVSRRGWEG